jgi:transposase
MHGSKVQDTSLYVVGVWVCVGVCVRAQLCSRNNQQIGREGCENVFQRDVNTALNILMCGL